MKTYFNFFIAAIIISFFFSEPAIAQTFQKHKIAVSNDYTYNGTWRVEKNPRKVADVNGDGQADIVGFANKGVYVSLGKDNGTFGTRKKVYDNFSYDIGSWRVEKHPREVADVNGDGRADIVAFGHHSVYVALGQRDGTFDEHKTAYDYFTYNKGGLRTNKHVLKVADVNGDKRADIVCFGENYVFTALGQSDGTFAKHKTAYNNFTYGKGSWRVEKNPREVADVNGDGRADVVGFGNSAVYVALGKSDGTFAKHFTATDETFAYNKGSWRVEKNPRKVADVNGDGRADIVGFGNAGVYVALGKSDGTFGKSVKVYDTFSYNVGSWRVEKNPREVVDVNGDGKADIVGFGNSAVYIALAGKPKVACSYHPQTNYYKLGKNTLQDLFDNFNEACDLQMTHIDGVQSGRTPIFLGIWKKRTHAYIARAEMSASEYQSEYNKYTKQGYRLVKVNGYSKNNAPYYTAIWEKNGKNTPYIARHGMTAAKYQQEFNTWTKKGYRLTHVSGYGVNGTDYYAAIWEKTSGPAYAAFHGLTASGFQTKFNDLTKKGYRLELIDGYSKGNAARFACIFVKKGGAWKARHHIIESQYSKEFHDNRRAGYTLSYASSYNVGGKVYYAAIWNK